MLLQGRLRPGKGDIARLQRYPDLPCVGATKSGCRYTCLPWCCSAPRSGEWETTFSLVRSTPSTAADFLRMVMIVVGSVTATYPESEDGPPLRRPSGSWIAISGGRLDTLSRPCHGVSQAWLWCFINFRSWSTPMKHIILRDVADFDPCDSRIKGIMETQS